jgi:hypothetical protein
MKDEKTPKPALKPGFRPPDVQAGAVVRGQKGLAPWLG